MNTYYTIVDSPIEELLLTSNGTELTRLFMNSGKPEHLVESEWVHDDNAQPFPEARRQLAAYFAGDLKEFDLPLAADGTEFQKKVWDQLRAIPYGQTRSYGEIAALVGNPNASRAVGMANGRNPISIVVPCHRVIGANGKLVGFGGGLPRKSVLLELEGCGMGSEELQLGL